MPTVDVAATAHDTEEATASLPSHPGRGWGEGFSRGLERRRSKRFVARPLWHATRRDDVVSIVVGAWLAVGLFVDGWAHNNLRSLETFFTPWHGLLYSGFLATALWYFGLAVRGARRRADAPSRLESVEPRPTESCSALVRHGLTGRIPVGYGWGIAGTFVFGVGGLSDMIWHIAFGIEQGIDALFSPTHLILAIGLISILGAPFRAAWQAAPTESPPRLTDLLPAIASASLVAATIAFFFMHAWPTIRPFHVGRGASSFAYAGGDVRAAAISAGTGGMLVMTLVMVGALLWMLVRWRLPLGAATIVFGTVATLMAGIGAFAQWPLVIAQLGAGALADILARRLDPSPDRPGVFRVYAGLVALELWTMVFATEFATRGLGWSREVNGGAIAWCCVAAIGLAMALTTHHIPDVARRGLPVGNG